MDWIAIAITAYFLIALEVILDKFLLSSKKVSHPAVYAFYSGLLSLPAVVFAPLGFHGVNFGKGIFAIFSGVVFVYGILSLFFAIQRSEASRVMPVVGATVPIVTYFSSFFFLRERLVLLQIIGIAALIVGGFLISFEFPVKIEKRKFFAGFRFSVLAGILLASAFAAFKHLYEQDNFINVFIWTRFGLAAGALSLVILPFWSKTILNSLKGFKRPREKNYKTGAFFVGNKFLGGTGSIMVNYAISLGSVTIVNALVSIEYVFILLLGIALSLRFPRVFQEKNDSQSLIKKIMAIIIITVGIILVASF